VNLLYLAHRFPCPPTKGDKIRAFRQLRHLAGRHRVWCACFVDDPADERHVATLRTMCEQLVAVRLNRQQALVRGLTGLLRGRSVTESFYHHPQMEAAIQRWSSEVKFDAVLAFSSSMAPYALNVPAKRRVLDLCDLDSGKWADYALRTWTPVRFLYALESSRLAAREKQWMAAFDASVVISDAEAAQVVEPELCARLVTISNGMDLPPMQTNVGRDNAVPIVGFVGVMNYFPNVDAVRWFVKHCWPLVRARFPEAVFRIVGRSPTRAVRRLARCPGVDVAGEVADVTAEVRRFDVSVAPLRIARGLQNKVLEAMAAAKPVVLSDKAAQGIAARPGSEFLVADTASAMADAIVSLLADAERRRQIGEAARRFVSVHHRWDVQLQRLEMLLFGILPHRTLRKEDVLSTRQMPSKRVAVQTALPRSHARRAE